jgi:hypothetical protein
MENHIRFQRTPILILLASAMGLASPQTLEAQEHNHKGELFPVLSLPVGARGADVPRILGKDKHRVAAWYGHTDEEFDALCFRDRKSLRSDRKGPHLHYFCEALPAAGDTPPPAFGPYPYAQTFSLHSRPTATRVIYLDFTGHTTSGTVWNSSFAGGASVVTPPYDTDGNPSAFSTAEMDSIQHIWMRVSEDYAPFDVDVTTADPGIEGLRKTSTTDNAYGVRACIGGSGTDWYGAQAGGVAYVGSFGWSDGTPAFIFSVALGNGYEKYVAEAVSHEVGHTLGLHHDGVIGGSAYFQGQNNWAPIMGVGYYADLVQFSKGEYSGANNKRTIWQSSKAISATNRTTMDRTSCTPRLSPARIRAPSGSSGRPAIQTYSASRQERETSHSRSLWLPSRQTWPRGSVSMMVQARCWFRAIRRTVSDARDHSLGRHLLCRGKRRRWRKPAYHLQ